MIVMNRIADLALKHARFVAIVIVVLVGLSVVGLLRLRLDFSSSSFYGTGTTEIGVLHDFIDRWGADDRLLAVVASVPDDDSMLTAERLGVLASISASLTDDPAVESTISVANVRPSPQGPTLLELIPAGNASPTLSNAIRSSPAVPMLLSSDGRHAAVLVTLQSSTDDLGATVDVIDRLRTRIAVLQGRAGLRLELGGIPAVRAAFFSLTLRDQMVLVPTSVAVIGVGLWLWFRHLFTVLAIGSVSGLSLLFLLGTMAWTGEPIGLVNQAYFTLIPVIAVTDAVHFVVRAQTEYRSGRSWNDAIVRATTHVGWACLLTSLTTAIGFASLAVTSMATVRRFGIYAALGILVAYGLLLVVLPPLLAAFPPPLDRRHRSTRSPLALRLTRLALERPGVVSIVFATLTVLSLVGALQVRVDNRLTELLLPSHPVAQANAILDQNLGGSLSLEFDVDNPSSPTLMEAIHRIRTWSEHQPMVRAIVGPDEMSSFRNGHHARVSVRVPDLGALAFAELEHAAKSAFEDDPSITVTGTTSLAYRGVNRIASELGMSLMFVFVVVSVLIGGLLHSTRFALIAIPPNAFPLAIGIGMVALWSGALDPIGAIILAVALGIAVDDSIHIMVRFNEERLTGLSAAVALDNTMRHSGQAITITSFVLAAGLAVNLLSSFPPLRMLGGLGAAIMIWAWLCDVMLLPAFLQWWPGATPQPRPEFESPAAGRD